MKALVVGGGLPNLMASHRHVEFLLSGGDHLLEIGYFAGDCVHGFAGRVVKDCSSRQIAPTK
jgi:hypothetical protein